MTSPDPVPPPLGPLAAIVTTDGTTRSATEVTGHALTAADDAAADVPGLALEPDDCVAPTMTPPTTPPTTSAVPSATHTSHRRGPRGRPDSLITAPYPSRSTPQRPSERTPRGRNYRTARQPGDPQQPRLTRGLSSPMRTAWAARPIRRLLAHSPQPGRSLSVV